MNLKYGDSVLCIYGHFHLVTGDVKGKKRVPNKKNYDEVPIDNHCGGLKGEIPREGMSFYLFMYEVKRIASKVDKVFYA